VRAKRSKPIRSRRCWAASRSARSRARCCPGWKEKELLAPLGERIGDAARAALDAGKSAGTGALSEAGLSSDQIRSQVSKLVEQALKAAGEAGTAAVAAARESASASR